MIEKIAPYAKFVVAVIIPTLALLLTFITGDEGFGDLTTAEWILVASAFFTAIGVFFVPNAEVPTAE